MKSTDVRQFSFGTDDADIGGRQKPFKAEAGRSYRVSFIWWPGLEKGTPDLTAAAPLWAGAPTNFFPGAGYVINKGPEYTRLAGGEAPRDRLCTVLVIWPTNKDGEVDKTRLTAGDTEVMPWAISPDKYRPIREMHKEWHFGAHDLKIMCTDTGYQKMTFSPYKENLLKAFLDKKGSVAADLLAKAIEVQKNIGECVGRSMTIAQLREKLSGTPAGAATSDSPVTSAVTTGEIDGLVDGILSDEG